MYKNRKRTKAMQQLVNEANAYFRDHNVKDEHTSDLFWFVTHKLLDKHMYNGFNFYIRKYKDDGTEYCILAGTADKTKYDFIQIW